MLWDVLRREDEYVGKRVMGMEVTGKEGEEDQSGGGWITSGTTCRRGGCRRRTRPHIKVGKDEEEEEELCLCWTLVNNFKRYYFTIIIN